MAKRSVGLVITINGTTIGDVTKVVYPERKADTMDATTLNATSGYKTFIQGFKEGGEITISGFYEASNVGLAAVDTAYESGTEDTYIITAPVSVGNVCTLTGIVTSIKSPTEANIDDPLGFEMTIKVVGKPVFSTVASTGVSAATFVKTDGTTALTAYAITPTFDIGKYVYAANYTTETSFKPKITAASHTIKLNVDGVFVENLTSGSAGTAIAMDAGSTKKLDIIVYETAKSPKTYTFMVSRLS